MKLTLQFTSLQSTVRRSVSSNIYFIQQMPPPYTSVIFFDTHNHCFVVTLDLNENFLSFMNINDPEVGRLKPLLFFLTPEQSMHFLLKLKNRGDFV